VCVAGSSCDNVVLELQMALHLQHQQQTTVFPLLVGPLIKGAIGGGTGEMFDDFFSAGCQPSLPPIRVERIDERLHECFGKKAPAESLPVDRVFASVLELQGHKLKGDRSSVMLSLSLSLSLSRARSLYLSLSLPLSLARALSLSHCVCVCQGHKLKGDRSVVVRIGVIGILDFV
jgi:hypothetical protein